MRHIISFVVLLSTTLSGLPTRTAAVAIAVAGVDPGIIGTKQPPIALHEFKWKKWTEKGQTFCCCVDVTANVCHREYTCGHAIGTTPSC